MSKKLLDDKHNKDLLNGFLHEYLPLIQKHVNMLKGQGLVKEDVIDEGDLHMAGIRGLMEAAHRYEHSLAGDKPGLTNPFGTYASTRIRGKMLDHIHGKLNAHVPKHIRTQGKNFEARAKAAEAAPVTQVTQPAPQVEPAAPVETAPAAPVTPPKE